MLEMSAHKKGNFTVSFFILVTFFFVYLKATVKEKKTNKQ